MDLFTYESIYVFSSHILITFNFVTNFLFPVVVRDLHRTAQIWCLYFSCVGVCFVDEIVIIIPTYLSVF